MGIELRQAVLEDIPEILEIEKASFAHPWSANIFMHELSNPISYYACCIADGELAGYVGIKIVLDEASLDNIAVKQSFRGQKLSKLMLEHAISICRQNGAKSMFLEVRQSNYTAINLYSKADFVTLGVIKGYYPDGENAFLMKKQL